MVVLGHRRAAPRSESGRRHGGPGGALATRRRLCVLRQIGDKLVPGVEQFPTRG